MSKQNAFLAVYPALDGIRNHADCFLQCIDSYLRDEDGKEKADLRQPHEDWLSFNYDWLKEALDNCPVEVLEMSRCEEDLRRGLEYYADELPSDNWRLILGCVEESLVEGHEHVDLFIATMAIKVFGYWGSFFFNVAAEHLSEDYFHPKDYDPKLLKEIKDYDPKLLKEIKESRYPDEPWYASPEPENPPNAKPLWTKKTGKLFLGPVVIRHVRGPSVARNITKVLDGFQELGWPEQMDDPLPEGRDQKRLHETIKSLNDGLKGIRFRADGTGAGFIWERV